MAGISALSNNTQWMFPLESERLTQRRSDELGGMSAPATPASPASQSTSSFIDTLKTALNEVNEIQVQSDSALKNFAAGKGGSLESAMIAMNKADLTLRTAAAVRNKLVEAYNEVMRMQV
jgi:flagellar hook-basal body complex protein FliE